MSASRGRLETPAASSDATRAVMRANRRISGIERSFRRGLWAAGCRGYRLQAKLPGRPDLVFPAQRLAVFVHGCFWHRCPDCTRSLPTANREFWRRKFEANVERDARAQADLAAMGWHVLVVWEHEIRADQGIPLGRVLEERDRLRHRGERAAGA